MAQTPYTRSAYLEDAVTIHIAAGEIQANEFLHLKPMLQDYFQAARATLYGMPSSDRRHLEAKALRALERRTSLLFQTEAVMEMVSRFGRGPNTEDSEPSPPRQGSRDSHSHDLSSPVRGHHSRPPPSPAREYHGRPRQDRPWDKPPS